MSKRLEAIELMLAKKPADPFVHYARAMELRSLGRGEEALGAFTDITSRFPEYVPSYLMGAQLAAELGKVDLARSFAERGIERAQTDAHALSELRSFLGTL